MSNNKERQQKQEEEDIERLYIIKDAEHQSEQQRRRVGSIFLRRSNTTHSSNSDTDSSDSFDQESISSPDEDLSSIKLHGSGPVKLYLKERVGNWPKTHYRKHRKRHLTRNQIPINYGSIHTKQIRNSLKQEINQRKQEEYSSVHLRNMMEDLPRYTTFLSLDPQNPILSNGKNRSSKATDERERSHSRSSSRLREIKNKLRKK